MQESVGFILKRSETRIAERDYTPLRLTAAICLAGSATSASAWLNVSWVSISRYAGVKLTGEVGSTVKVDYVDSLTSTNWLVLTNVVLPSNPYIWIDYESPDHPARFYRATRQ